MAGFTSASGPEGITQTVLSTRGKIDMSERQWRQDLGIGAAARASTDKPRSSEESYSDFSESVAKALLQETGAITDIGGSGA